MDEPSERYERSLLRISDSLGRASAYRAIVDTLRPEIEGLLGRSGVWLLVGGHRSDETLLLDAGGAFEESVAAALGVECRRAEVCGDEFLVVSPSIGLFALDGGQPPEVSVVEFIDLKDSPDADLMRLTGCRSVVSVPLIVDGVPVGRLGLSRLPEDDARVPDPVQVEYLSRVGCHVAMAVERIRTLEGPRHAAEDRSGLIDEIRFGSFLLENIIDGVIVCDAHDRGVLYVNEAFCGLVGGTAEDLTDTRDATWISADDRQAHAHHLERALRVGMDSTELCVDVEGDRRTPVEMETSVISYLGRRMLMSVVRDISARRAAQSSMEHMALHDPLTGLANRVLLTDRLEMAIARTKRSGDRVGVILMDIDHFKEINDSAGHSVGDLTLMGVADRLRGVVRGDDTVARLGGDEFTLVLPGIGSDEHVCRLADTILEVLSEPLIVGEQLIAVTASIGIVTCAGDVSTVDQLLRNADLAMYSAKQNGRNSWRVFDPTMSETAFRRHVLKSDVCHAIEHEELELHYQPIVRLSDGEIVAAEALCRWEHATFGRVPPTTFIPLAEEAGMASELSEWVLREACGEARRWMEGGAGRLGVSVNLSPRQMCDENVVRVVHGALKRTGLSAGLLEVEITESIALREAPRMMTVLSTLRASGVRIAVDDFGTGYSSLDYLRHLPVDTLKVDRVFVRDVHRNEGSLAITRAIVSLARALKVRVIAEGVECDEQRRALIEAGCQFGQGFLFAEAVTAEEFGAMLAGSRLSV